MEADKKFKDIEEAVLGFARKTNVILEGVMNIPPRNIANKIRHLLTESVFYMIEKGLIDKPHKESRRMNVNKLAALLPTYIVGKEFLPRKRFYHYATVNRGLWDPAMTCDEGMIMPYRAECHKLCRRKLRNQVADINLVFYKKAEVAESRKEVFAFLEQNEGGNTNRNPLPQHVVGIRDISPCEVGDGRVYYLLGNYNNTEAYTDCRFGAFSLRNLIFWQDTKAREDWRIW